MPPIRHSPSRPFIRSNMNAHLLMTGVAIRIQVVLEERNEVPTYFSCRDQPLGVSRNTPSEVRTVHNVRSN